jgi:plasmid rolling circle replication initiator protein Rep
MKLFLKVLLLIGLVAVGKWEKSNSFNMSKPATVISYPTYFQNTSNPLTPKQVNTSFQKNITPLRF